ncbi:16S rRNA (uracil(1498)-N(3))-methyltransferase [Ketobacter sp. MCCC 1A13808]|uniref:16S rRNA (uracil(1498)-N(3))-methyltransferase n=1 Tax=Ketobacter sp. MCCC 1A13808 TaxID=2602738 RepID=UPI0012EC136A|nr:16S rRNA (uracil(1498)-N(3))-methyltransferase [Ketobacter sp. MCCC 1A13808]MVF13638.1 16S rRNA (uracil(1498)-N(3))-methyltransferase [Ketobacter sp. MCCC 1A13808]
MRTPRIFQDMPLIEGNTIAMNDSGSHHLSKVLRKSAGDPVILFNGTGGEYHGLIEAITPKSVQVSLDFFVEPDRAAPLHLHLGQVMGKGDHMDYALQKSVELGVSEITPLLSHHCEVRLKGARLTKKMEQWRHLMISACEQSGLNIVPTLNPPLPLLQWAEQVEADRKWILHTEDLPSNPFAQDAPESVCFAVGPEGGFSDEEVEQAKDFGFDCITLGPRVWRTETAPVVLLSLLQLTWGDFR